MPHVTPVLHRRYGGRPIGSTLCPDCLFPAFAADPPRSPSLMSANLTPVPVGGEPSLPVPAEAASLAPYDPAATSWSLIRKAPSWAHWMGTDENGRDVLARVIWGARASLLAGVVYAIDGTIQLRLLAGYEARTFSSAAYKTIEAPVVEAAASWTPSGLTTVTASAARYIEDAASEAVVGLTETALRLGVDHEYRRNIVLSASAAWLHDTYQQGGQQALYEAVLGATWRLNRTLRLGATYQFYSRQSNAAALAALGPLPSAGLQRLAYAGTFAEHRLLLQLRLGL